MKSVAGKDELRAEASACERKAYSFGMQLSFHSSTRHCGKNRAEMLFVNNGGLYLTYYELCECY